MFILFIIAGMIICFAIILLTIRIPYIRKGILTEATIVAVYFEKATGSEDHDTYYWAYNFFTLNNEEIIFTIESGSDSGLQVGDKATIVYQPYNPKNVVFLNYWDSFGLVTVLFCMALILILIAAGYYWAAHFFNSLTYS